MTLRTIRSLATALAVLILGTTCLTACGSGSSGDTKQLTVGFVVDPSWAQVPVAEQAGYFKAEGIDVKVVDFSTGVQALQALASGQVDVTTAADVPAAASLASSSNMKVIADGSRWKGSVIVANRKSGIQTSKDLSGKKLGTPLGTSAAYFASSFLKRARVKATLVQSDPSAMVTAIDRGDLDAVSVFQPYQQQVISALSPNAVVLHPASGTYVQQSLFLASQDAVQTKATTLSKFEAALNKASSDLKDKKSSAIQAVASATKLSPHLVRQILPEFDYALELPPNLPAELTTLGQWAQSTGNLEAGATLPKYSSFINAAFLPRPGRQ